MKTTRSLAGLAAATTLAALSPLLGTASPALADDPGDAEVAVYLAASPGSDAYGVFRRPLAGGAAVQLVAPDPDVERSEIAVSQDGRRYTYVETVYNADGDAVRDRVVVHDVNGPFGRRVLDRAVVDNEGVFGAALSPDGRTVVWNVARFPAAGSPSFVVNRASVFGGAPVVVAGSTGLVAPTFVSPTLLLATRADTGAQASIPLAGGTRTNAVAPADAGNFRVSPDGTQIVFQDDQDNDSVIETRVESFAVVGSTVYLDNLSSTTAASGRFDGPASWRRDGSGLLFTRAASEASFGDIWKAPATAPFVTTSADELDVVVGRIDVTAPGAITSTSPATLAGTSVTIPLDTVPADSDWSGTYVRRTLDGVTKTLFVPVGVRVNDSGLTVGKTYSYTFAAVDSSGNVAAFSAPRLVTATAPPSFTTADPTSATSVRASFPVVLSAVNAATTRYTVAYGRNGGPGVAWLTSAQGNAQAFGSPAATGRAGTISYPGSTYRFAGRAYDAYGNATGQVGTARYAVVPFDQGSATFAGSVATVPRTGAYGGTSAFLRSAGAQAAIRIAGNRVQVIGERGPTTGRFVVYDNGVRVAVVDTRASTRQVRQVLFTRALSTSTNHTITVRAEGTTGRPTVVLDGISTRRF